MSESCFSEGVSDHLPKSNSVVIKIRGASIGAPAVLTAAAGPLPSQMHSSVSPALRRAARVVTVFTGLALCAEGIADPPAALPKPAPDPRSSRLEKFFEHYKCPAPRYVAEYLRAADSYGLDFRLLPALSIRETHCGLAENRNNHWGYNSGRRGFPSVETGIVRVARQLAESTGYKGKTLEAKLFTYNPRSKYPEEIMRIMRQIE